MDAKVNALFVRLMMMTTSPNDNEALVAMRKANAVLASANVNWAEFLSALSASQKYVDNEFRKPPSQRRRNTSTDNVFSDIGKSSSSLHKFDDANEIDPMFEDAFSNASGSFANFLESVHEWWIEKGFLTEKQYYAVKRAAEK